MKHFEDKYANHIDEKLGDFLGLLIQNNDNYYKDFLNKFGDEKFCKFKIEKYLNDKGLYCFIENEEIKYIGR